MKKIIKEFKEFAVKGNVIDMAVGLVIGSAFTAIVTALTQNIFLPVISIITGGIDYSAWNITVGPLPLQRESAHTAAARSPMRRPAARTVPPY